MIMITHDASTLIQTTDTISGRIRPVAVGSPVVLTGSTSLTVADTTLDRDTAEETIRVN